MYEHFHTYLDISKHFSRLWSINIPTSLCGLLWKAASGSLPIGRHFWGTSDLGCICHCRTPLSLGHMWGSCPSYNLCPLLDLLCQKIDLLCNTYSCTLSPYKWKYPFWYPLQPSSPWRPSWESPGSAVSLSGTCNGPVSGPSAVFCGTSGEHI